MMVMRRGGRNSGDRCAVRLDVAAVPVPARICDDEEEGWLYCIAGGRCLRGWL